MGQHMRWSLVLATAAWAGEPLGSSSSAVVGDKVILPSGLTKTAVVLVRGERPSAKCLDAQVEQAQTSISVGDLVPETVCPSEVAVFSQNRRMTLQHPSWTAADDAVALNPGPPRLVVELNVYIATSVPDAARRTKEEIARATRLYKQNRVGIRFNPVHFVSQASAPDRSTIGVGCSSTGPLKSAGSPLFDPARVNVYVVDSVTEVIDTNVITDWRGYNCWEHGVENIIYLSAVYRSTTTLAHELGHLLGLRDPCGHPGFAALTNIAGFTHNNIMWSRLSDALANAQDHFSLGQAYRINTDEKSWLNRPLGPSGVAIRSGETRSCQHGPPVPSDDCPPVTPARDDPCPPLALDVPAGVS